MKTKLGSTVTDKITGLTGIVTGRVEYISGCNQLLVSPKIGNDGAPRDAVWFDEQRCSVDSAFDIVTLENGSNPGHDKAAPVR